MSELLAVFGRLHPAVLHVPLGLVVGLAALEAWGLLRRDPPPQRVVAMLATLTQLAAAIAVLTGLSLVREDGYPEELSELHRNLGLAFLVTCVLVGRMARREDRRGAFRVLLAIALGLGGATGHFGGSITHGGNFLFEPLEAEHAAPTSPPAPPPTSPATSPIEAAIDAPPLASFAADVAPILAAKCVGCHGEEKRKGRLALHTREAIEQGGGDGPVFVAGDSARSALIERMRLPSDDDDHMPPGNKPQPSARAVALIAAWIDAGASFDAGFAFDASAFPEDPASEATSEVDAPFDDDTNHDATAQTSPEQTATDSGASAPDARALAALTERLVHVQAIAQDDPLLWIDFSAPAAQIDDRTACELLEPLVEHVGELSLARTLVGDGTLRVVAQMRALRRLDLRSTQVTDAGFAQLEHCDELRELNLSQTALGEATVDVLAALPKLERVFVWRTSIPAAALARLHEARPTIEIDAGDAPDAAVVEAEPEVKFTSDAPLPGAKPSAAESASFTPINATCPVSGSPVNPKYSVVFEGRVVGFCCPNCPKEFWADPQAFADKLAQK